MRSQKKSIMACILLLHFAAPVTPEPAREEYLDNVLSQIPFVKCHPGAPNVPREKNDSSENKKVDYDEAGFMAHMTLGLLPGDQEVMRHTPVSLRLSLGMHFPSRLYLGAGLAVESFDPPTLPLYGDIRWYFTSWEKKPWIGTTMGYALAIFDRTGMNDKGGFSASIGAGMVFPVSTSSFLIFYWGYRYQELHSVFTEYWNEGIKQHTIFNRMEFCIGLGFR